MVDGRVLRRASVWGKHLFHHYADGPIVHVHLGLYGTFTEWPRPGDGLLPEAVGQVRMRMVGADYGTDLRGPTVCELIDEAQVGDVVARLGPDPLRSDADPSWAWARIAKSRRPIGALLMDQTVIAGVGNVYRSELLFRHRIDPFRPGREISETEFDAAWTDLVALMKVGLARRQDRRGAARTRPRSAVLPARSAPDVRVPARRRAVPGVRRQRSARLCSRAETCSGVLIVKREISHMLNGCGTVDFVSKVRLASCFDLDPWVQLTL